MDGINKKVEGVLTSLGSEAVRAAGRVNVTLDSFGGQIHKTLAEIGEKAAAGLQGAREGIIGFARNSRDTIANIDSLMLMVREIYARIEERARAISEEMREKREKWRSIDPIVSELKSMDNGVFGKIGGKNYGGNQEWFSEDWQKQSGCGPTAAANILAYLAFSNEKYRSFYGYEDLSKENYTNFMHEVIEYVKPVSFDVPQDIRDIKLFTPGPRYTVPIPLITFKPNIKENKLSIGVPSPESFKKQVEKFAESKGVELKGEWSGSWSTNYGGAVETIKAAMDADLPVALLMYWNLKWIGNEELSKFQYHWVTITGIEYNEDEDAHYVTVSSWGVPYTLNFKDIWNESIFAAIVYFQ